MLKVGDRVTYLNTNLRDYIGRIEAIGKEARGANCKVQWLRPRYLLTTECLFNLVQTARTD